MNTLFFYSLFIQDSCNFVHLLIEPRLNYATTEGSKTAEHGLPWSKF